MRVLLDAFFDNQDLDGPRSNLRTVEYLAALARAEGLDLQAARGNPTGGGLHNKMILARIAGQGWILVGSLNGGEASAKLNREMSVIVASGAAYAYLADVFWYDWGQSAAQARAAGQAAQPAVADPVPPARAARPGRGHGAGAAGSPARCLKD